jgi:ribosomal protein S18 acetylase RimI-like enzyme
LIVGYCSYTFDFSTWDARYFLHLDCLFIEEGFRGMSIGEKLITQVIFIAKQRKCVNVQWQTPIFNEGAIRFYKRIGATGKEKQRFTFDLREDRVTQTNNAS